MKKLLEQFDEVLAEKALEYEGTVIGGAALIVLGVVERVTKDVDCLEPTIPEEVKAASVAFARSRSADDVPLIDDWFNNGPESLLRDLPKGWKARTRPVFQGKALRLRTLGKLDLLRAKIWAFCDRQQDFQDCVALAPSRSELEIVRPWLAERDLNPDWPEHVRRSINAIGKELGYDPFP